MIRLNNVRRNSLGAIELIELGQSTPVSAAPKVTTPMSIPAAPQVMTSPISMSPAAPPGGGSAASRTVAVSANEARLIQKTVENVVSFAQEFPIEFHSYCPTERWQETLLQVGTWSKEIERNLNAGVQMMNIPAEMIFRLVDLEKCASAARESRVNAARWAFGLSAAGTIANVVLGIPWITVPTYLAGLAVLFGGPILAKTSAEPQDPYKPAIGCLKENKLSGCAAPKESDQEKEMIKCVERVILPRRQGIQKHWWGQVACSPGPNQATTCIKKGRLRVRVEGWEGDTVTPAQGWDFSTDCDDKALNVIGVYEVDAALRETGYGPLPEKSRHAETYWVEYTGPKTNGKIRRAGPFGCPLDTQEHAVEDGGITEKGVNGDYVLMDVNGEMVPVPA